MQLWSLSFARTTARYPVGATVSIKVRDGLTALVPGSMCDMR